jgi:dTMP kinase
VHAHLQPDLTLLFDLPAAIAGRRIAAQARARDRFEQEQIDFHERVRQAYLERAAAAPQRMAVIDADQSRDKVAELVQQTIARRCS